MSGCAGSKFGITNDVIPLKKKRDRKDFTLANTNTYQVELKDLRLFMSTRLKLEIIRSSQIVSAHAVFNV